MFSIDELLGMIVTESVEEDRGYLNLKRYEKPSEELPTINYELRLVRYPDGRMEWKE